MKLQLKQLIKNTHTILTLSVIVKHNSSDSLSSCLSASCHGTASVSESYFSMLCISLQMKLRYVILISAGYNMTVKIKYTLTTSSNTIYIKWCQLFMTWYGYSWNKNEKENRNNQHKYYLSKKKIHILRGNKKYTVFGFEYWVSCKWQR